MIGLYEGRYNMDEVYEAVGQDDHFGVSVLKMVVQILSDRLPFLERASKKGNSILLNLGEIRMVQRPLLEPSGKQTTLLNRRCLLCGQICCEEEAPVEEVNREEEPLIGKADGEDDPFQDEEDPVVKDPAEEPTLEEEVLAEPVSDNALLEEGLVYEEEVSAAEAPSEEVVLEEEVPAEAPKYEDTEKSDEIVQLRLVNASVADLWLYTG
ncbi:hypothetical protein TSTA_099930 [Talaromyces stipitatus ATCC 10500]|uniref:Uncharacterized protein n=1 Tax=Talaromyces stipitatus (strain ATCC 10500 / CBS 375.48 / QM 6759 / NRRL 1006) TaxID=441959 RepID=B8MMJ1_TALSN|nr:uncharacterized protein TSTA_099930 [Talaromyces stipitatus ATCC 10500]EED13745.1 hypothetical protein TSTA_099930 [Talaromyces stipitatus ATCC 10500]